MTQFDKYMTDEEKRLIANDKYDLSKISDQVLAMEFIAVRREILEYGFKQTSAYDYMNENEQDIYDTLYNAQ